MNGQPMNPDNVVTWDDVYICDLCGGIILRLRGKTHGDVSPGRSM